MKSRIRQIIYLAPLILFQALSHAGSPTSHVFNIQSGNISLFFETLNTLNTGNCAVTNCGWTAIPLSSGIVPATNTAIASYANGGQHFIYMSNNQHVIILYCQFNDHGSPGPCES